MSKKEEGKAEPTLVYWSMIEGLSRVREYGIKKYGKSEDWRTTSSIKHFDAMLRHIFAFMSGEEYDHDSGMSHLWHAAANIMFEIERRHAHGYCSGPDVEVTCPRCHAIDRYPTHGVYPCTGGCGYFIEVRLEKSIAAPCKTPQ